MQNFTPLEKPDRRGENDIKKYLFLFFIFFLLILAIFSLYKLLINPRTKMLKDIISTSSLKNKTVLEEIKDNDVTIKKIRGKVYSKQGKKLGLEWLGDKINIDLDKVEKIKYVRLAHKEGEVAVIKYISWQEIKKGDQIFITYTIKDNQISLSYIEIIEGPK